MVATMPIGANVVEVGAWLGRSTAYLARACQASRKDIRLSVVDTWEGSSLEGMYNDALLESQGSVFDQFRRNMEAAEVWNHLTAIKSTSVEASQGFPNNSLDFVCLLSVYAQSMPCVQLLVGDGEPVRIPEPPLYTRVASIPGPHRDTGNAARAVGCTLAIAEGCDAIAFLDADNWYMPQHLEVMLSACAKEKAVIASSGRTLHALDGSMLGQCPDVDGKEFVDTNCMFFMRPAFGLLNAWAGIPESLRLIGDRVVWRKVIKSELPRVHVPIPSVCYRTMYRRHYAMFQKPIPKGAKVLKEGPNGIEAAIDSK